jgi:hypothetical protein
MKNNDQELLWEAYEDMPPQCPRHLLEEGLSHQLHAWILSVAIPKIKEMVKKNPKTVIAAGGLAALLAAKFGLDPDTAQTAVDGIDPETLQGLEGSTEGSMTIDLPNKQVLFNGQPATHDQIIDHIESLEKTKASYLQWIDNAGDNISDRRLDLKFNQVQELKATIKDLESFIGIQ